MYRIAFALVAGLLSTGIAHADVRAEEKSQVRFEGMLGRMLNLFGGRAARDGIVSTVSVKGDRKMTVTGDTAQIIDLQEEKVYDLNLKDKSYTVTTFAEMRRQIEDARRKAAQQAPAGSTQPSDEPQKEMEVDFDLEESGQRKPINGFDAREVVMTIAVREKGKTLEESGGFVLTSNSWLAPKLPAMSEVAEFDRRYADTLATPMMLDAQQMAAAMAMYPMMRDAMAKLQAENVNLDGTPVMTVTTFQAVANPAQAQQSQQAAAPQEQPRGLPGLGGLGGRLGRRIMNRGNDDKPAPAAGSQAPNRTTVMTITHEVMKVTPAVSDADVALPAGFRLKS
jgi:hypothetical protein